MLEMIIEKMREWDIDVVFASGQQSFYSHDDFLISIDDDMPREEKLFTLLHEVGHAVIHFDDEEYEAAFPVRSKLKDGNYHEYCEEVLREEIWAWEQGLVIAKELGIEINEQAYNELAEICLEEYRHCVEENEMFMFWHFAITQGEVSEAV
jgi:hypothetical protein